MTNKQLYQLAIKAYKTSYAPYSKFKVGAAIIFNDKKIYTGCNIENISYGLTICAERVALFKGLSEGSKIPIKIAIASNQNKPFPPCGACRQVLIEFNHNIMVIWQGKDKNLHSTHLSKLLPNQFK